MLTVVSGLQQNDSVINTCDDSVINTRMRAKLLQSCRTLCNPVDCSPPGFSVHGVSQARIPFFPLSLLSSLFFDVCVTKPSSVTLEVTWSSQNPQIPLIFISTVICPAPWFWETCVASSKNRLSLSLPCFLVFINLKKNVATLQGTWDLSSLTRDQIHIPCIGRQGLNHSTTREIPLLTYFEISRDFFRQVGKSLGSICSWKVKFHCFLFFFF